MSEAGKLIRPEVLRGKGAGGEARGERTAHGRLNDNDEGGGGDGARQRHCQLHGLTAVKLSRFQ